MDNPEINLAWDFVNKTDRNIFLTGKAGTGKTTFLHRLSKDSLKRLIVVAPTGVAAINAKGVTIHSFFQLPFGPILPSNGKATNTTFSKKFSRSKINIIKSLDLLIIDEISMVRADLLDGIDSVLKRYRNRNKPFGGVQLLMIGDLQQLSPVIKDSEWSLLRQHYSTGFFFGSNAFRNCNALTIELKKIYRQDSADFIKILNEIRNNKLSEESSKALNTRYLPEFSSKNTEGYITLTTHNNKANSINAEKLKNTKGKGYLYKAEVEGTFTESTFPTHVNLELKKGAQVMFIKNDSSPEKNYYNGKIGQIVSLTKNEVTVRCPLDDFDIVATPEEWENINYSIKGESEEIIEDKIGSFKQVPLRLAWAITIHKSQGLTFENIIIDAKEAFAHGQTYVALSRCKTLEGIVLTSPIANSSIINNSEVGSFSKKAEENQPTESILNSSRITYQLNLIDEIFNFYNFLIPVNRIIDISYKNASSLEGNLIEPLLKIKEKGVQELLKINAGFKVQLKNLSDTIEPENNNELQERFKKAIEYFENYTKKYLKDIVEKISFSTDNSGLEKDIDKQLDALSALINQKQYFFRELKSGFVTSHYLSIRAKSVIEKKEKSSRSKEFISSGDNPILYESLRDLRMELSIEDDVPPYQIFTQKALAEICHYLPTTLKQLKKISDIGKIRLQKYGEAILEVINDYCESNDIEGPEFSEKPIKKVSTQEVSYILFRKGKNVDEIAKERNYTTGTIIGHLSTYIKTGKVKATELMPEEKYLELKKIMETEKFDGFSELKNKIDDKYSYQDLKLVSSALEFENN